MEDFISLNKVIKRYKRGQHMVEVLYNMDLSVARGEFLALMGPSGSGKSTLLNVVGGLDSVDRGEVRVAGQRLDVCSARKLSQWRARNVGLIFQQYYLLPTLSVQRNVMLPLLLTRLPLRQCQQRVDLVLGLLNIAECARRMPAELSGGQQQRVAIARAIVADPVLLICDEPTGDLDRSNADTVLDILQQLNRKQGKTIVMATHDPLATGYASRTVRIDKGKLVNDAVPRRSVA